MQATNDTDRKKSSFVKIFSLSVIKCNIFTLFIITLIIYSSVRFHVKKLYLLLFSTSAGICTRLDCSSDEPGAGIGWSIVVMQDIMTDTGRSCAGILEQSVGNRYRVGIGLPYRPARLHRLAESIPRNRFLGSLKV